MQIHWTKSNISSLKLLLLSTVLMSLPGKKDFSLGSFYITLSGWFLLRTRLGLFFLLTSRSFCGLGEVCIDKFCFQSVDLNVEKIVCQCDPGRWVIGDLQVLGYNFCVSNPALAVFKTVFSIEYTLNARSHCL